MTLIDATIQYDRLPPNDQSAELCALGSLMLCGDDLALARSIVRELWPEAFYCADNQILFRIVSERVAAGQPTDAVIIRSMLLERQLFEEVGGTEFLANVLNCVPSAANGPYYAKIVAARAREREVISICNSLTAGMYDPRNEEAVEARIESATRRLNEIRLRGRSLEFWRLGDAVDEFVQQGVEQPRIAAVRSGVLSLDGEFLGVFSRGMYTVIAGRPSMGKSTFARWLLREFARTNLKVGLIAIEETKAKIAGNYISAESGVDNNRVANLSMGEEEWGAVRAIMPALRQVELVATDAALNLRDVLAAFDMLVTQYRCDVIAVDHLHLLRGRKDNRNDDLTEISGALKLAIKRAGVVGLVLAQLSRPENRQGNPGIPQLMDLRESGAIEEHADAVLMLHRDDYYRRGSGEDDDNVLRVAIRKNRNGPVGIVPLTADLRRQRFFDVDVI